MSTIPSIETFTNGQVLTHTSLNTLVSSIRDTVNTYAVLTDVARTISAVQTFSAAPVFSAGYSVTGTITMATAASKIVPGATSFSIRNNADAADNLILTDAGAATFRSTVGGITTLTATTLAGTLSTAAQPNVTSLGTIASLVATNAAITTLTGAPNFSGTPTFGAGFTVTAGTVTLAGVTVNGNLTLSGTSRKVIGSTTSTLFRDTGDSKTWLSYTDATSEVALGGDSTVNTYLGYNGTASATTGHVFIPAVGEAPNGAVVQGAIRFNYVTNALYIHNGTTWKSVTLT